MADTTPKQDTERFTVRPNVETHFSWLRTRLSTERTLMSWVRTAVALIAFGFTIFQFLDRFNKRPGFEPARHPHAPWILGMGLIGAGTAALAIALWQYRWLVRYLWSKDFEPIAGIDELPHHTPIVEVSVVLIMIGVFAFASVLLRMP